MRAKKGDSVLRAMLNRYRPMRISRGDLRGLLERRSDYEEKIGLDIFDFQAMSAAVGKQCFRLVPVDGPGEGF